MKTLKSIPVFQNEDEEHAFWAKADTTDYFDWSKAKRVTFPNLKPSTATISLRLPQGMLDELKVLANPPYHGTTIVTPFTVCVANI